MEMFENATHKKWYMVLQIRKNEQKIVYIHECNPLVNEDSALYTNVVQNYEYLAIFL